MKRSPGRCGFSDTTCRGSYPDLLGALLGPSFEVRNFGVPSLSACGQLPAACGRVGPNGTLIEGALVAPEQPSETCSAARW